MCYLCIQVSVFKRADYIVPYIMERIKLLDAAIRMVQARGDSAAARATTAAPPAAADNAQEAPPPSPAAIRLVPVVGVTAAMPDTPSDTPAAAARSGSTSPRPPGTPAGGVPPGGSAPHGADFAFNIRSVAVDDLIEQAGPELFTRVQSSRPTQLPAGMAVSYEIVNGALLNEFVEIFLEITVARARLLPDLIASLDRVLAGDKNVLMLPLR
jgi:hypothetical protein